MSTNLDHFKAIVERGFSRGEPTLLEVILRHAKTVVSQDEKVLSTEVVDLDVSGIGVMGILEELADRGRNPGDLLPSQHVDRPGSYAERSHQRRLAFR